MKGSKQFYIVVRHRFEGFHCWMDAPLEVSFLRNRHRHMFHVEVRMFVDHTNREQEFFLVQRKLADACYRYTEETGEQSSCEEICDFLYEDLRFTYPYCFYVSVFEDGENGAVLEVS